MVGLTATGAKAQVTFTLDDPTVTGVAPGSTVPFTGTIFNGTGLPVFVVDWAANSPFLFDAPGTVALVGTAIAPGGSASATLFSVLVDPSAPPGTYTGFLLLDVGREYPPTGRVQTLSANFSVSVGVSAVPEPATLSLLAAGAGVLAVVRRRRRAAR
jgi:hypothetical protein